MNLQTLNVQHAHTSRDEQLHIVLRQSLQMLSLRELILLSNSVVRHERDLGSIFGI